MTRTHLIGLLLGTEDDWPTAFEQGTCAGSPRASSSAARPTRWPPNGSPSSRSTCAASRSATPWSSTAWPTGATTRGVAQKIALMDRAYLLNNPFTFQSMEKHAGYCAAIRLGFDVPATWLLPHKVRPRTTVRPHRLALQPGLRPTGGGGADRLPDVHEAVPRRRRVNVYRIGDPEQLRAAYDASGRELMRPAGVEGYDIFTRGLAIGPQTMVTHYDPTKPLHLAPGRPRVPDPELGTEIVTFGLTVGAFFRWEFNSFEVIVRDGQCYPIDFANATPDMAIISLHYYFRGRSRPWRSGRCTAAGDGPGDAPGHRDGPLVRRGRRPGPLLGGEAGRLPRLVDDYLKTGLPRVLRHPLAHADDCMADYIESSELDAHLVATIQRAFPPHEHEQFVAHYRGARPPGSPTSGGAAEASPGARPPSATTRGPLMGGAPRPPIMTRPCCWCSWPRSGP